MYELDRILGSEQPLQPSSGLADSIMEAVRRQASAPEPIRFPWFRVLPGMIGCVVLLAVGLVLMAQQGVPVESGPTMEEMQSWLQHPAASSTAWVLGALMFSYLAVKLPTYIAGRGV